MTMSTSPAARSRGHRLRLAGLVAAAFVLITAPNVSAANATNINVQLPTGYSIAGTIRDSAGALLADADVYAIGTVSYGYGSTDAAGKYKMIGLAPGAYVIQVAPPNGKNLVDGYYTTANANHFTAVYTSATKVTVSPNKTGIDVKLPAGFTISGTVTTTAGAPLANAQVGAVGPSYDSVSTSSTGKFTLRGLRAGSYKLTVSGPGGTNYLRGWYSTANSNHFVVASASSTSFTLGPNKSGLTIKVPTGYSISGKITNTTGTALPYVGVSASSSTYSNGTSTDGFGNYTIKGLASGSYKLNISPQSDTNYKYGYYTSANTAHFTGAAASATSITVGPTKTGVNIKVATGYTISGTITNASGTPLAEVDLYADNLGHYRFATTDVNGKYTIKGLSSGAQRLSINNFSWPTLIQQGYYTTNNLNHFTVVQSNATTVTVGPNKTGVNAKIPTGYSIAGKVTGPGGVALQYAGVSVSSANGYGGTSTAANGTYKVTGLPAGTYKVQVDPGYNETLVGGWYTTANANHYTTNSASATSVTIGP